MSHAWFGWKQVTFFKVQLYSPTFRRRKSCTLKNVNKSRSRLKRRRESAAPSPHIKLSSVKLFITSEVLNLRSQMLRTARYGVLYEVKLFSAKVLFLIYSNSQQDLLFRPARLREMTLLNVTFLYSKKLCAKFYTTHRVIFLLTYPLFLISIVCSRTCSDSSSQSCCSTANGTSWQQRVSHSFNLN